MKVQYFRWYKSGKEYVFIVGKSGNWYITVEHSKFRIDDHWWRGSATLESVQKDFKLVVDNVNDRITEKDRRDLIMSFFIYPDWLD
jgi:hypothetical protein